MQAPDAEFIDWITDEWFRTMKTGQVLAFEKSRRLWASWALCCLDVWDACRRQIVIVQGGKTYDKASDFVYRCYFIYEELRNRNNGKNGSENWNLPECDFWGNPKAKRLDKLAFANGSVVEPLNSDGEAFRGSGYARVKLEELSSYRYVAEVLGQASAVTMGPPDQVGGHVVAVCNASANDEWQQIKKPLANHKIVEPYDAYDSAQGTRIVRIHYSADPEKTPEWCEKVRKLTGWTDRIWRREMELDDSIHEGDPIFEDFIENIHCPASLKVGHWDNQPGSVYVLGVDAGQTLFPAGVLLEIGPAPYFQVAATQEWTFEGNTPMSRLIPKVLEGWTAKDGRKVRGLKEILPGQWDDVIWVGDSTITTRDGSRGETSQHVAYSMGITIRPMSNNVDSRLLAVDWLLTDMIDNDTPRYYVCGYDCPRLLKGFQGAYKAMEIAGKPDNDRRMPDKNIYSHVHDALQYGALYARSFILAGGDKIRRPNTSRRY